MFYLQLAWECKFRTKIWQKFFLSTLLAALPCFAKIAREFRLLWSFRLWMYIFVNKQWCKVLSHHWRSMWGDLQMKIFCWPCVEWVALISSKICFVKVNLGETLRSEMHPLFSSTVPCCDASHYASCTFRSQVKGSWLISRRNVCFMRSFIDWLVATKGRSMTLLFKHWIHSFKFFMFSSSTGWEN